MRTSGVNSEGVELDSFFCLDYVLFPPCYFTIQFECIPFCLDYFLLYSVLFHQSLWVCSLLVGLFSVSSMVFYHSVWMYSLLFGLLPISFMLSHHSLWVYSLLCIQRTAHHALLTYIYQSLIPKKIKIMNNTSVDHTCVWRQVWRQRSFTSGAGWPGSGTGAAQGTAPGSAR